MKTQAEIMINSCKREAKFRKKQSGKPYSHHLNEIALEMGYSKWENYVKTLKENYYN